MYNILENFFYGKILPWEHRCHHDSRYEMASDRLIDIEKKLLGTLTPEALDLYKEFTDAQVNFNSLSRTELFTYAFQLGMLMGMEVMEGKHQIMEGDC